MPRYKLTIEYDGTPFVGWQRQINGPSVQAAIEDAVVAFCGETVRLTVAGRTDAGVHALGQVAHLDLSRAVRPDTLRDATNAHLRPAPVAILDAEPVGDDFHARFGAIARLYRYRIVNRRAPLALARRRAWHVGPALDVAAMGEAAAVLLGRHDFSTFRAADCQAKSAVKTLDSLTVARAGDVVIIETRARSFLKQQVRSMVGSLKLVGLGRWSGQDLAQALDAKDRAACGPVAPPFGLYLVDVDYGAN